MPREVIMPALGMAQETGLIVAWLKREGEAVAEGDALFEVETDKATMEVEAQGAGFLTNVRATEGESVPVGGVLALISETAEGTDEPQDADGADDRDDPSKDGHAEEVPGRRIIMPALGMAQDTGRIVDWLVSAGDEVAEGDPLFEVETDKATMEVPSDAAGYVAAMYAAAGDDVPVGQVIAVISPEKPEKPVVDKAPPEDTKAPEAEPGPGAAPARTAVPAAGPGARILASPRARRLAAERGIDLQVLVDAGLSQPFHAADLDGAEARPAPSPAAAPQPAAQVLRILAGAPAEAFDAFADWAGRSPLPALAAGALRAAARADHVVLELRRPGVPAERLSDPDLSRPAADAGGDPALILRDLTATRLTAVDAGAGDIPVLTATRDGQDILLALAVAPDAMGEEIASDLAAGLADRLADPMRQLF
jgi:pyruvate/2-oxoglutarate dehydrogenase complex dihydrolipoamide acyltransferase (E2) component